VGVTRPADDAIPTANRRQRPVHSIRSAATATATADDAAAACCTATATATADGTRSPD